MMDDIISGELLLNRKKQSVVLTLIVVFILLAVLIFFYLFSFIPIEGESMENTIHDGQYCFVQRKLYEIERGDIVIVDVSEDNNAEHDVVKRVIALSGDRLLFMRGENGNVVNLYLCKKGESKFVKLDEPYIKENMSIIYNNYYRYEKLIMQYMPDITEYDFDSIAPQIAAKIDPNVIYIPENHVFFLGDNRNVSRDSRYYGTRPLDKVKYKVLSVAY